jgi:hypothetical protein
VARYPERGHGRRWLVAGGVVGLLLTPAAARYRRAATARALRLRPPAADPVAPFREAPCYADDEAGRGVDTRGEEALPWEPGTPKS